MTKDEKNGRNALTDTAIMPAHGVSPAVAPEMRIAALHEEIKTLTEHTTHALRTPLWALTEFAQMLADEERAKLSAGGQGYLDHVIKSGQRLTELIKAVQDYTLVCQHELCRAPLDLSGMAEEILAELRQAEPHRQVHCTIQPGLRANADEELLRIALKHLLGNAWKFTYKAAAAGIAFEQVATETAGRETLFFIKDNGLGFDETQAAKLFCPFRRLHGDPACEGVGMGLVIVRRIMHLHGGRIRADGRAGQGAVFCFTMPEKGVAP